jgi:hypothetical protein
MADLDVLRVAALKVVADYAKDCYETARKGMAGSMEKGDRLTARSPIDGSKIASVSKTEPRKVAVVFDQEAFTKWLLANYPESVGYDFDITGSDQEVKSVLFEHAPHLLRRRVVPSPELVKRIKQDSVQLGVPIGPNGEAEIDGFRVDEPEGDVRVRADEGALVAVVELFRAGRLTLEELVLPQLPAGDA